VTGAATGIVLFGHGSRLASANDQLRGLAARLRASGRYPICEAAFLELTGPTMPEAVKACVEQGAGRVVIVPYFLAVGRHVAEDIPALVHEARRALGPGGESVPIEVTDVLGNHPWIVDMIGALVEQGPRREAGYVAVDVPPTRT
jgi:sirohydrochlorin ferrochelatase